jgi:hypothetical protein
MDSNIDPKKCDDNLLHDKETKKIQYQVIQKTTLVRDNIDYWIEDLQLTKVYENILLDSNGWLSDQHLGSATQILYVEKLQSLGYEQHTYMQS